MTEYPAGASTRDFSLSSGRPILVRPVRLSGFLDTCIMGLLSIFAFVLPTDIRFSGDKSIAMRVGYLCVCLGVVGVFKRRTFNMTPLASWFLMCFVVWSTCTLAWAKYPGFAQHKVISYWVMLVVSAIIPQYAWHPEVRWKLFDAYIAGCWCGVIGVLIQYVSGARYTADGTLDFEGRYSFGTDPNYFALALVIGLPLAFYRMSMTESGWKKTLFMLYIPAALVGIILTGSRGALLALLASVAAFGLFTTARMRLGVLAGSVACLILVLVLPSSVLGRFATIPDELSHGTLSDRRDLWERGTSTVEQNPVQGIGAGATAGMFSIAAHNTPLELLMEGGAIGFSLFYGAMILGVYRVWKVNSRERVALLVVFAAWLVGTLSLSWELNTVTWFIFAMLFSAGAGRQVHRRTGEIQNALPIGELSR